MTNPDQKLPPQWKGPPNRDANSTGAPPGPPSPQDHGGGGGSGYDAQMHERIARLETTVEHLATKSDIDAVRVDFERGQKENRAWMLATVIALFLGILTVGNFIASGIKGSQGVNASTPAPPLPLVIYPPVLSVPAAPAPLSAPPNSPEKPTSQP